MKPFGRVSFQFLIVSIMSRGISTSVIISSVPPPDNDGVLYYCSHVGGSLTITCSVNTTQDPQLTPNPHVVVNNIRYTVSGLRKLTGHSNVTVNGDSISFDVWLNSSVNGYNYSCILDESSASGYIVLKDDLCRCPDQPCATSPSVSRATMESLETSTLSSSLVRSSSTATPTSTPTAGLDDNTGLVAGLVPALILAVLIFVLIVVFIIILYWTRKKPCRGTSQPYSNQVVVEMSAEINNDRGGDTGHETDDGGDDDTSHHQTVDGSGGDTGHETDDGSGGDSGHHQTVDGSGGDSGYHQTDNGSGGDRDHRQTDDGSGGDRDHRRTDDGSGGDRGHRQVDDGSGGDTGHCQTDDGSGGDTGHRQTDNGSGDRDHRRTDDGSGGDRDHRHAENPHEDIIGERTGPEGQAEPERGNYGLQPTTTGTNTELVTGVSSSLVTTPSFTPVDAQNS